VLNMKISNILTLSSKNVIRQKKTRYSILFFCISTLLIIFVFSFRTTMVEYLETGIKRDINYRTIFVSYDYDNEQESDVIKELEKIEHIVSVFSDNSYYTVLNITKIGTNNVTGDFFLKGGIKETIPSIIIGQLPTKDNEIVCPVNFYPNSDTEMLSKVNSDDIIHLNKKIDSLFQTNYFVLNGMENLSGIDVNKELKLVGLYQNSGTYIDENVCYTTHNTVYNITKDSCKNLDLSEQYGSIIIQIDNTKNLESVTNAISEKGYMASLAFQVNTTFFDLISLASIIITFVALLLVGIIIFSIHRKSLNEKSYEIALYRTLGYNKKDIENIILCESLITGGISIILSIIITLIFIGTIILIRIFKPFIFSKMVIFINLFSIIISIVIMLIASIINNLLYQQTITKASIIGDLKC